MLALKMTTLASSFRAHIINSQHHAIINCSFNNKNAKTLKKQDRQNTSSYKETMIV